MLYTGGTTGLPKGVLWRHEDMFFGGLGSGNPGGPPISAPEQIAASVLDNPPQRLRPFLPAGDSSVQQFVSLALGPLMHASGQWSALGTLLGGGKVVLYGEPHVDIELVLDLIERERVNAVQSRGRRERASDARRASSPSRTAGIFRRCACSARAAASCRAR